MIAKKPFYRLNENIRAVQLRVIAADGKQLGVLSKDAAIKKAKEIGLTLVEIAPNANPPVAKIVEFGKFLYQEEKKLRREHKKAKASELKEVRFSPFIAENDYQIRLEKVKDFLSKKDKVRPVVVFKGPQMRSRQFGYNLLNRIVKELGESIAIDMNPKFLGKHLMMVISPTTKGLNKKEGKDAKTPARNATHSVAGGKN